MKTLSILFILVFGLSAFGQSIEQKIEKFEKRKFYKVNYDKFKNSTEIRYHYVYLEDSKESKSPAGYASFGIIFDFDGKTVSGDVEKFYLTFTTNCRSWCFLHNHSLLFLNDGEKLDLGDGSHDGKISRGSSVSVSEFMVFTIRRKDLTTIANSKLSEFQLGNFEAIFNAEAKQVVKNMLELSSAQNK